MAYKLSISKRAQEQLDECLYYLMFRLKNSTAAEHLLSCIESVYERWKRIPISFRNVRMLT